MMIECAECGKSVSDKAASCPNCGAAPSPRVGVHGVRTVQLTSKRYKAMQLIGGLTFAVSVVSCAMNMSSKPDAGYPVGSLIFMLAGLLVYTTARILAWWHHR